MFVVEQSCFAARSKVRMNVLLVVGDLRSISRATVHSVTAMKLTVKTAHSAYKHSSRLLYISRGSKEAGHLMTSAFSLCTRPNTERCCLFSGPGYAFITRTAGALTCALAVGLFSAGEIAFARARVC